MPGLSSYTDELATALETINVPSYIVDPSGVVQWVNLAASRLGDVRGRKFTSIVAVEMSSAPLVRGGRVIGVFGQIEREQDGVPAASDARLTPRQSEVLRMLEQGCSTEQIAHDLHLSQETVRNHVRHVLRALGVHSRLEAVAVARGAGVVQTEQR